MLGPEFEVTRSRWPSPFKSATAMNNGVPPTGDFTGGRNVPSPFPNATETPLFEASARSGIPSPLKSPVAIALALKFGAISGGVKNTLPALLAHSGDSANVNAEIESNKARWGNGSVDMEEPRDEFNCGLVIATTRSDEKSFADSDANQASGTVSVVPLRGGVNMQETATLGG